MRVLRVYGGEASRSRLLSGCGIACWGLLSAALETGAFAQQVGGRTASDEGTQADDQQEIVVVGTRGSAVIDLAPLATFDADALAATGATTMSELLQAIRGSTQAADGSDPIFLLNAQRVSSYQEIGSLPPEAIEKVEVLPEQSALRYGFPPTRRVTNFITKARFRQIELRGSVGSTTD